MSPNSVRTPDVETQAVVSERRHILTVSLEDYFQGAAFQGIIRQRQWPRFETHLERNTATALDMLDRYDARATFFADAWTAETHPEVIRQVAARGHEVACAGVSKRSFRELTRDQLRHEVRRSREAIENVTGVRVRGFRVADHKLTSKDLWGLEVLAEEGFDYDSSLSPWLWSFHDEPRRRFLHRNQYQGHTLWEAPLSSMNLLGASIPVAGGNYFRQLPERLIHKAIGDWMKRTDAPFVMYFRVWDLGPDQPDITGAPFTSRVRHYRNPGNAPRLLEHFLARHSFTSVADYLGLLPEPVVLNRAADSAPVVAVVPGKSKTPMTVVVPCYNEEASLAYLSNTLRSVRRELGSDYDLKFAFVDDGSQDQTWQVLENLFGDNPDCRLIRHPENRGVAAAILTGIRSAETEIVCSIDCDCTYDPHDLKFMAPKLVDGVDLVTASPYHPEGRVLRVPKWRLALSKTASWLYSFALKQQLYTYSSCFRVYRRSVVAGVQLQERGFLGVTEILARLDLAGARIVEHPATLEMRLLGRSKMRTLRTIGGHLRLISKFAWIRLRQELHPREHSLVLKGINRD